MLAVKRAGAILVHVYPAVPESDSTSYASIVEPPFSGDDYAVQSIAICPEFVLTELRVGVTGL